MNEASYRDLISGRRRGLAATSLRAGLTCLSVPYAAGVFVRNGLYHRQWLPTHGAGVPVVSVGNLTAGGTGKTPIVAFLVQWFQDCGMRPGILSRGYRAHSDAGNDEKLVLDQLCPGVPHVQNPDRVAGAKQAFQEFGCQLLVLDDGFQHRRLRRDLDIVLIDSLNPWGGGHLLPRGLLREPVGALRRADLVILTRIDQCETQQKDQILAELKRHGKEDRCVDVAFPAVGLVNSEGISQPIDSLHGRKVAAFCGIGNPQAFRQTLDRAGIDVCTFHAFRDHNEYTDRDLADLERDAQQCDSDAIVTTQKDLVKVCRPSLGSLPLWSVQIAPEVLRGQDILEKWLSTVLGP